MIPKPAPCSATITAPIASTVRFSAAFSERQNALRRPPRAAREPLIVQSGTSSPSPIALRSTVEVPRRGDRSLSKRDTPVIGGQPLRNKHAQTVTVQARRDGLQQPAV